MTTLLSSLSTSLCQPMDILPDWPRIFRKTPLPLICLSSVLYRENKDKITTNGRTCMLNLLANIVSIACLTSDLINHLYLYTAFLCTAFSNKRINKQTFLNNFSHNYNSTV